MFYTDEKRGCSARCTGALAELERRFGGAANKMLQPRLSDLFSIVAARNGRALKSLGARCKPSVACVREFRAAMKARRVERERRAKERGTQAAASAPKPAWVYFGLSQVPCMKFTLAADRKRFKKQYENLGAVDKSRWTSMEQTAKLAHALRKLENIEAHCAAVGVV